MSQEDAHQLLQTLKNHSNRTERDSMRQWNNMEFHKITRTDISSVLGFKWGSVVLSLGSLFSTTCSCKRSHRCVVFIWFHGFSMFFQHLQTQFPNGKSLDDSNRSAQISDDEMMGRIMVSQLQSGHTNPPPWPPFSSISQYLGHFWTNLCVLPMSKQRFIQLPVRIHPGIQAQACGLFFLSGNGCSRCIHYSSAKHRSE